MPIYTYLCSDEKCGISYTASHGMNETPEKICVDCGMPARKVPSRISVKVLDEKYVSDVNKLKDAATESKSDLKQYKESIKGKEWK